MKNYISIITITYNNFSELKKTISSIAHLEDIESIVINGGECELTKKYLIDHHQSFISERDQGISDAFNKGLRLASGDAILFLNSGDTLIDSNYIKWAIERFQNNPNLDFTYSDIFFDSPDKGKTLVSAKYAGKRSLARGMPYPHQSLIIRKRIFDQIGNFDTSFRVAMDFDLVLRMKKLNANGDYYNGASVLMDGGGISSKRKFLALSETYRALKKNNFLTISIRLRLFLSYAIAVIKKIV